MTTKRDLNSIFHHFQRLFSCQKLSQTWEFAFKERQSFLGPCTYLPKFIPNYSERKIALRKFLKKNQRFAWNTECQNEFQNLKEHLTEKLILKFYDNLKPVELDADSSEHAIGAIRLQREESHVNRPIAFILRTYYQFEKNVMVLQKEKP